MPRALSTLMNAVVTNAPKYHPAYKNLTGAIVKSRLVFGVVINDDSGKSNYYNGFILWDKMADVYAHLLYPGKYITVNCLMNAEVVQARYKDGSGLVYERNGDAMETVRVTHTVKYIELGHNTARAREAIYKKAFLEVQSGTRLPAWNLPHIRRTSGTSDYDIHKEWYQAYIHEPYAGQPERFGHARVTIWPTQETLVITGIRMDPPTVEETRIHGDYIIGDKVVPFDEYVRKAQNKDAHPITGEINPEEEAIAAETQLTRAYDGPVAMKMPKGLLTFT